MPEEASLEKMIERSADAGEAPAFDWQNCWYPVSFLQDLPKDRPVRVTLYDQALVLFFDAAGHLTCLKDRCPHRAARLSDGQMVNGRLECSYHGWQFGTGGRCLHIPQLLSGMQIPEKSHVRSYPTSVQGEIVWIWAGDPARADPGHIPTPARANAPSVFSVTFQMDLPYDQSYLIENVIDVAHIHIAHHGVRGGGLRAAAKPLEFQIAESSIAGIRSTFRSVGLERGTESPSLSGATVEFVAPNLIRYVSSYRDPALIAGLELFSLPLGKDKCRLLYRKYSNFTSTWERQKPRWMEHLIQCKILEQDMAVVVGQSTDIEAEAANLKDMWLPLKSSDRLVIEYRRWLDRFGQELPFFRGFATSGGTAPVGRSGSQSARPPAVRHVLHTEICQTCSRLHRGLGRVISALWALVAVAAVVALAVDSGGARLALALAAAAGLLAIVAARQLRQQL